MHAEVCMICMLTYVTHAWGIDKFSQKYINHSQFWQWRGALQSVCSYLINVTKFIISLSKEQYHVMTSMFCLSVNICILFRLDRVIGMVGAVLIRLFQFWTSSQSTTTDLYIKYMPFHVLYEYSFIIAKNNSKHCTHLTYTKTNLSTTKWSQEINSNYKNAEVSDGSLKGPHYLTRT